MPMIPDPAERNHRSTPQARIGERLACLYGADRAEEVSRRILRIIETHKQLRTRSVTGPLWTHRDVVLITYGNTIQSATHPPLQTLRSFLGRHLPEEFSMVHKTMHEDMKDHIVVSRVQMVSVAVPVGSSMVDFHISGPGKPAHPKTGIEKIRSGMLVFLPRKKHFQRGTFHT